jgi:hypothetical protein
VNSHSRRLVGCVEGNAKGVELSIVGENLISLLRIIRRIQELDLGVQLLTISPQANLELLRAGVYSIGPDGRALADLALWSLGYLNHSTLGVTGCSCERELGRPSVDNVNVDRLVASANESLDWA